MPIVKSAVAFLCVAFGSVALAAGTNTQREFLVRELMAIDGIPGLQTVVVKDGKVVWAKEFGYAVLKQPGPIRPMRGDTLMWSASVGKLLVMIAVLQQVDQGRLKLDNDINSYVPFGVRNPHWPDVPITWRMLMNRTSSMKVEDDARVNEGTTFGHDPTTTLDDRVESEFTPGNPFYWSERYSDNRPGTKWIYNNDTYDLLAYAIERLAHEPFDQYVSRAILKPLQMHDTSYRLAGIPESRFAVGYASVPQAQSFEYIPAMTYWFHRNGDAKILDQQMSCPNYPSGCAHTTARDFAQIMRMLMGNGVVDGTRILSAESVTLMETPTGFRTQHGGFVQGLGLFGPLDVHGIQTWGHDGQDVGAGTAFFYNRKSGVGAIAFANANSPDFDLTYSVVDIDLHLMNWFE
jgi:CubicO group peptidase (beta-lactamase class C family)